jgi:hypothetical protein
VSFKKGDKVEVVDVGVDVGAGVIAEDLGVVDGIRTFRVLLTVEDAAQTLSVPEHQLRPLRSDDPQTK